jgi:Pyridoxamine 5'-phosphate oxidase
MSSGPIPSDLDAMARRVIDCNYYMTLGTSGRDCRSRLSPVYYTCARYSQFYWVSSPRARHSWNIEQRPAVDIVIFDSTAPVGAAEAVYIAATAHQVPNDQLQAVASEAFRTTTGATTLTPDDLRRATLTPEDFRRSDLALYVAHLLSCEVHVPGNHPIHGRGSDTRRPADPTSPTV